MTAQVPEEPTGASNGTDTRQRVLFIGGLGRSGSTLVERLLHELGPTFAVGETVHLWERGVRDDERCSCGAPFSQCAHWIKVGRTAFGGWDKVDLGDLIHLRWSVDRSRRMPEIMAAHLRGVTSEAQDRYRWHLQRVLTATAEVAMLTNQCQGFGAGKTPVLLESSKHLSTAALLALDEHLDVRVLHLVRDPRGVAYSWTKEVARPEADGDLMPRYRPSRTAARWVTDNLGFEALAQRVPTLSLRYEDLMADPVATIDRILRFMDLDPAVIDLDVLRADPIVVRNPLHSVAGNPMRFGATELRLRLDDRWRTALPRRTERLVSAITAPLLPRYGYPLRPTD
ncbi:MAG: sulfotransferase [Actinomycetota bacterium]